MARRARTLRRRAAPVHQRAARHRLLVGGAAHRRNNLGRLLDQAAVAIIKIETLLLAARRNRNPRGAPWPLRPLTRPTRLRSSRARIGFAKLTKLAFDGVSLLPLFNELTQKVDAGVATAGDGMDLSLITQLLGERDTGLAIQNEVLAFHRLYRSPCAAATPRLRVLALAAAIDMGGNTPIEFLLEDSGIELTDALCQCPASRCRRRCPSMTSRS